MLSLINASARAVASSRLIESSVPRFRRSKYFAIAGVLLLGSKAASFPSRIIRTIRELPFKNSANGGEFKSGAQYLLMTVASDEVRLTIDAGPTVVATFK